MINARMRTYDYYTYGEDDGYGQPGISADIKGQIKMAISITSQSIQDNINYQNAEYVGLTLAEPDDSFVIQYGTEKLKVLYVNTEGRYNQVFMVRL